MASVYQDFNMYGGNNTTIAPFWDQPAAVSVGGASMPVNMTFNVTFQIEGNATPETVQTLQMYGEDFAERVLGVVEDAYIDKIRMAMT